MIDHIADVLPGRQTAIFVLLEEIGDGGIEVRVVGVDFPNLILEGAIAGLLPLLIHPAVDPFDHGILGIHLEQQRGPDFRFFPLVAPRQVKNFLDLFVVGRIDGGIGLGLTWRG